MLISKKIDTTARMFSSKDLWLLLWPLIIEQLLAISLGMADIIMVGSLGEVAMSGVSIVDAVFILVNQLFAAIATGGAVVASQYIGRKDTQKASATARQLIISVTALASICMILGFFVRDFLLVSMFGHIDSEVMAAAQKYFVYTLCSMPSIALYNSCAALFRAQGNSKVSMYIALLVNILNIGGNAFLLYGLGFGVEGVAIPTFVARTIAAGVLLYLLRYSAQTNSSKTQLDVINIRGLFKTRLDFSLIKRILHVGIPAGLENSVFQIGKILVMTLMASFGTSAIAANAAANTIAGFQVLPGVAVGMALLTIVGQCIGADRHAEAIFYVKKLLAFAYGIMFFLNITIILGGTTLLGFYGLSNEAIKMGWQMILLHGVFGILIWPLSFSLPNAFRAANDGKFTLIVSLVSMWTLRVGGSYFLAAVTNLGAVSVWVAMVVDWILRSSLFITRFKSRKWLRKKLI